MFTPHLTKILCYTEHPLSIQVLHDRLAQVFLSLWGVPHCLCHHSTDLRIEILQGMIEGLDTRVLHARRTGGRMALPCRWLCPLWTHCRVCPYVVKPASAPFL